MATNPTDLFTKSTFSYPFGSASYSWLPGTMTGVFELGETIYRTNGIFRAGIDRIARLFMTDFVFKDGEETESKKIIRELLYKKKEDFIATAIDYLLYGNIFNILYLPFKRMVSCSNCANKSSFNTTPINNQPIDSESDVVFGKFSIEKIKELSFDGKSFRGRCPICNTVSIMEHQDTISKNYNDVNIIRLNPKQISIDYDRYSGKKRFQLKLENEEVSKIKNNKDSILLSTSPLIVLLAAFENKNIELNQAQLLHIHQTNIAGKSIEWGMPFVISCFPLVFYISILRKANEAISNDYIIPMRILFPQNGASGQEGSYINFKDVISKIKEIIDKHREDPNGYYTAPGPIGYEVIGGEKKSLMISEDLKMSNDELLNSMGFPVELFYGSVGYQAAPMALRMLDNTFGLTELYNKMIKWYIDGVCSYYSLETIDVKVQPLRYVDDGEKRQFILQAASADKISEITLLEQYGLNWEEEQRRKIQQKQIIQKLEQEEAEKTKQQQIQQQGGSTSGMNPMQILEQAQSMANQLLTMDESTRRSELHNIAITQPLLHHAIIGEMNKMTNQMKTQGKNQILQQMQQGG